MVPEKDRDAGGGVGSLVMNVSQCVDNIDTIGYTIGKTIKEVDIMVKTANINIRIDPETKSCAEKLFSSFGITITDAINIFLRKSIMEGGLPFDVKQPRYSAETEAAIKEAKAIMDGQVQAKRYPCAHALFEELDAEMDGE